MHQEIYKETRKGASEITRKNSSLHKGAFSDLSSRGYFLFAPHHWEKGRTWKHVQLQVKCKNSSSYKRGTRKLLSPGLHCQARAAGAQDNIVHNLSLVETVLAAAVSWDGSLPVPVYLPLFSLCSRVASKFCAPCLCPRVLGLQFALQYMVPHNFLSLHHSLS